MVSVHIKISITLVEIINIKRAKSDMRNIKCALEISVDVA